MKVCGVFVTHSGKVGQYRPLEGPIGHSGKDVCVIAGGAGKVRVVKAGWGKKGWVGGQAGSGADVSRAEDELHAKTQSHRCLGYSLEQGGGGRQKQH